MTKTELAQRTEQLISNLETIYLDQHWREKPEKVQEVAAIKKELCDLFTIASDNHFTD